ncbi:MAG: hypothetical protein U0T73_06565 [Chitinophagales bacterium]
MKAQTFRESHLFRRLGKADRRVTQLLSELDHLRTELRSAKLKSFETGTYQQVEYVEAQVLTERNKLTVLQTQLRVFRKRISETSSLNHPGLILNIKKMTAAAEQALLLIKLNAGSLLFL